MAKVYETLRNGGQQFELHGHPDCDECRFEARMRNRADARAWLQQFKGNALCMTELRHLLARESDVTLRLDRASEDALLDQAARMFEIGRWHVHDPGHGHRSDTQRSGGEGKQSNDGSDDGAAGGKAGTSLAGGSRGKNTAPGTSKELTWIEIQLVDAGGLPVPGMAYEIKLPDGSLRSGKLDAVGKARHEEIVPGQCAVRFPDLDGGDWKPA
jgi:hypothetical protein